MIIEVSTFHSILFGELCYAFILRNIFGTIKRISSLLIKFVYPVSPIEVIPAGSRITWYITMI